MPWWLAAIVFFFVGMTVERFIIDRKFVKHMEENMATLKQLREEEWLRKEES